MNVFRRGSPGFSFFEIMVGVFVFAVLAVPTFQLLVSSRTDTSHAINYLRALELAQEGLEWVGVTPFNDEMPLKVAAMSGSLAREEGGKVAPVRLPCSTNPKYSDSILTDAEYSEQYNNAYFLRTVEIEEIGEDVPYREGLKKVVVTVQWNEGTKPKVLEPPTGQAKDARTRKVTLSMLIVNPKMTY